MVRHMESGAAAVDSGALAEGVWEYVNNLVKSYGNNQDYLLDTELYKVIYINKYFVFFSFC